MPSKDRVTMDMSPESAAALRKLAAELSVPLRDAAFHGAGLHAQMHLHLAQMSSERDMARADLAKSEEALRVAKQSAHDWRMRVQSDKDILLRQANLIDETQNAAEAWKAECLRYRAITAWDHLRAARAKAPFLVGFLFGIPPGCVAVAAAIAMGVLG